MTDELNKQAWLRFLLGVLTLLAVVWGSASNFEGVRDQGNRNETELAVQGGLIKDLGEDVHLLELQDKETMIRQQQILSELGDIKTILRSFEVVQ